MERLFKISSLLLLAVCLLGTGCASSKKGQCGCPAKQGMVGYK